MGCCTLRATCIFASFFTLIQGLAWGAAAVAAILIYTCKISMSYDSNNPVFYFNLIYFYRKECQDIETLFPGVPPLVDVSSMWPDVNVSVERTFGWAVVYVALSSCWIVTSLLLAVTSIVNTKGPHSRCLSYYPWLVVTALTIIADVVALTMYSIDIGNTKSLNDTMQFIGVTDPDLLSAIGSIDLVENVTSVPSIIMATLFGRFAIVWVVNLTLLLTICVALHQPDDDDDDDDTISNDYKSPAQIPNGKHKKSPKIIPRAHHDPTFKDFPPNELKAPTPEIVRRLPQDTSTHDAQQDWFDTRASANGKHRPEPKIILPDPRYKIEVSAAGVGSGGSSHARPIREG
uniref:Uncharacterized protein n=1 Tax=Timema bartmani TaxID=61472 RepID=A0A7R9EMK4_9NEOP|nr:unnamed protein product [Timema bartmani]